MIFATVGTQLPFPRLTASLADLAGSLDEDIAVQAGRGPDTSLQAPGLQLHETLTPAEFEKHFKAARVIVAHAGIGTILSARQWGKPLVILPRRHALGEHRNDHQIATAHQVENLPGIYVAWSETHLADILTQQTLSSPPPAGEMSPQHTALVDRLRDFIDTPATGAQGLSVRQLTEDEAHRIVAEIGRSERRRRGFRWLIVTLCISGAAALWLAL
ncbi:UDP-N-acetylglucosamine transferase subunit ALG13 [Palleronia marisminoris]|uniref:Glycosyl transferase family 28 C-terminal domain-containing protein n=1 Tax=Palleronia marisminoris TaxID=315423 RepID=A0A1Y5SRZ9_9RHOB|nr:glycosyltransferase [Palleronia marisminoris]SFG89128.1 UDP-N-acetylglucosamine transferase subunit ALG13 [Palleronia marisminoris]SLN43809.1 hypothetical protein PAM7066_01934 [Palleronia marisminoris]